MSRNGSPVRFSVKLALLALCLTAGLAVEASAQTQDINGDGMVDAVFTQKQRYNQVCFGNGTGAFTTCTDLIGAEFTVSNQVNTTDADLVDWDGDGDLDIALAMEGHANVVCFNDGAGRFNAGTGCLELAGYSTFPYNSQEVAAGDLDGDGAPDLVWANGGNAGLPLDQPNVVCLGLNDLVASTCHEFGTDAPSTGVALGDVDNDGDLDVLISNRGTLNEVCLNGGRVANGMNFDCRPIPQAATVSATKVSNAVAVGHLAPGFGGVPDAHLDVVFANNGKNEVCFGNGDWSGTNVGLGCLGLSAASSYVQSDASALSVDVAIGDFMPNPYAGPEIVFANLDAPNVRCYTTFTCAFAFQLSQTTNVDIGGTIYAVLEPVAETTTGVAIRDINIDGRLDVVVANDGISRTSLNANCCSDPNVIANSTLHPSSVTLSGGTVGPTIDTTPPAFTGATNVTVEATGPTGATAQYSVTAVDVVDGARPVSCAPVSGSTFPFGNTTVTCTSVDTSNNTGTATFLVTVRDTTGPVVTVPANRSISATSGQLTAAVPFSATAHDVVDGARTVTCFDAATNFGVASGDQFPGGTTTLVCGAYDTRQNYGQASFTVTVTTDVDSDGILDNVDPDDDNDGIADSVDAQSLVFSSAYLFNASTAGTVTRNGRTVSITPVSSVGYSLRASISGTDSGTATIVASCGGSPKELRLDTAAETVEWRCDASTLAVKFVSGAAEFWKSLGPFGWERIMPSAGNTGASAGSPVTADPANTAPMLVTIFNAAMTEIGSFSLEPGESMDVQIEEGPPGTDPVLLLELLNGGADGTVTVTLFNMPVTLQQGNGPATFSMTQTVFASGTATVTAWDPIFPATAFSPWQAQCAAAPAVGPNADWLNPHAAFSFPLGSHIWEDDPPMDFSANWINAWSDLDSRGPSGQSWTKYSTQVTGEGDFVVQFLADNCSWIYLNDQLIGVQDDNWSTNSTGRYPVTLTGAGPHTLSFIIFDGGGAAGGKFRLETRQSFIDGGGDPDDLPTKAPTTTTVSFGDGPFVYSESAFTAVATVSNNGVATIAYSGDCINAGSTCTATATFDGDSAYFGSSATASITIDPAPTTTTVNFSSASYVYTGAAIEATASDGASIVYSGSCTSVGTCTATATTPGDANHIGSSAVASAEITKAPTTTTVSFGAGPFAYRGWAFTATASTTPAGTAAITYGGDCTNAGNTCTATAAFAGDANHFGSSNSTSIAIERAAATVVASPYVAEYDGQPHSATFTITGVNGESGATVGAVTHNTTHTNVGTYADVWSFAGANYVSIGNTPITNTIKDTTAPSVGSVTPSTGSLWPPNHQMVNIGLAITSSDLVGVVKYNVTITSNEADNGLGDGDTANDIQISGNGTLTPQISLRSERRGGGSGRTYTISVIAVDVAGNASAAKTATVSVPKSQGKK